MLTYPLDIRGVALRHLQPEKEFRWVAPFEWNEKIDLDQFDIQINVKRKLAVLFSLDGAKKGRRIARAACIAARQGRLSLSHVLMVSYVHGTMTTPELEARAQLLIRDESRQVNRLLNSKREWPKGVWNLQDVSAWLVPTFIHRLRLCAYSEEVVILSGCHLLAQGEWVWKVPEDSIIWSEVAKRQNTVIPQLAA